MTQTLSPGAKFRQALHDNQPLQVVGAINAYAAMMAESIGHRAIYLSGGGVANASMQTRAELYEYLGYHAYEQKLDTLFSQRKHK